MNLSLRLLGIGTLSLLLTAGLISAQTETGSITGTVTDQSGAVVPDAKVTVKNLETGALRVVETTSAGAYLATNLLPGNYLVTVEMQGFSTAQRQANVTVGSRIGLDLALQVGQTGVIVEVSASAATVNTETQTLGSTVTQQQIIELPTFSRDPYTLVATVGNVSPTDPSGRGVGYAINGQRSAATNVMLDGTSNNDEFTASRGQTIPLDSVQEFSVLTNNFTAEFGRASAGVVNVATKSGTNGFHGSAYEFNRLSHLASNDFNNNANSLTKPVFTRNQPGYSIGGPVLKNKLFFFNNTEWIRVRSTSYNTVYVPTQDFINAADPATKAFFSTYGQLRSGLQPLGTLSKNDYTAATGGDICKGRPLCAALPGDMALFNRVAYAFPSDSGGGSPQNTWMTVGRVDYNMSDRTQMYVRYAYYNELDQPGTVSNSPYSGFDSPNTQVNNSIVYSLTRTFGPRFVSQTKVDFNRFNNQQPFSGHGAVPTLYLSSATTTSNILGTSVALPGYLPFSPGNGIPFGGPQNYVQLYQDFSYIRGKHSFRFGGTYTYLRDNRTFGAYETAIEALGNNLGLGMENFLAGQLYQFQAAVNPQGKYPCAATVTPDCTLTLPVGAPNFSRSNRYGDYGLYAQDSWKLTPRLTLNLGLRWEVFGTQHNKDPKLDSNYYLGSGSTIQEQISNGSVMLAPDSPGGKLWKTNYGNVGPRIGIAWDVTGSGKTSIRAGYGRFFERNFGNVTFNIIQNPPNYAVLSLFGGTDLPSIPVSVDNAGPLGGSSGSKELGRVSLRAVDPNIKTAYVDSWSLAVEHRLGQGVIVALEYSGSNGEDQYGIGNINISGSGCVYGVFQCADATRLHEYQYSNINYRTNGGFSKYQSLNTRVEVQNVGRTGLNLRANYTWSHAIDTLSDTFSSSGNQMNLGWLDIFNPAIDKGDAYYDLRHRVTVAAVYTIPTPANTAKALKHVIGGWSVIPTFSAYTGSPFSMYDCTNAYYNCPFVMLDGVASRTAVMTATSTPNLYNYFDVSSMVNSSFANPISGSSDFAPYPSNMYGRNAFRGPGAWDVDFAIHKNFQLTEGIKLQLRGEFFNVMNHPNLYSGGSDSDVSGTGGIISAHYSGRRQTQLGVRIDF